MKKITVLFLFALMVASCNKGDSVSTLTQAKKENIMVRIESVSGDSALTYSPIINVEVER